MTKLIFAALLILQGAWAAATVNISAAVELGSPGSLENSEGNALDVRSLDLSFFGAVDPTFDGVLTLAGHRDDGEIRYDVHEAHVSASRLVNAWKFRLGKFFIPFGRLNSFHRHDWLFVAAPKSHREFLAPGSEAFQAEGAADTGIEAAWMLPTERFVELTAGATNGYCFGHCHGAGARPPRPLVYLRAATFGESEILTGLSWLSRVDASGVRTDLYGVDVTLKEKEGRAYRWLLQGETQYQVRSVPSVDRFEDVGGYVYVQRGLSEAWSFGFRVDLYSSLNTRFVTTGERRKNLDFALVPCVSYQPSEFSRARLAYAHEVATKQGDEDVTDRQLQFQFVYLLGAHPAHDF